MRWQEAPRASWYHLLERTTWKLKRCSALYPSWEGAPGVRLFWFFISKTEYSNFFFFFLVKINILSCFPPFPPTCEKKKKKKKMQQKRNLLSFAVLLPKIRHFPAHGPSRKYDSLLKHRGILLAPPKPSQPEGFYCFYLIINKFSNCLYGSSK